MNEKRLKEQGRLWFRTDEEIIRALEARRRREHRRSLPDTVRAIVEEAMEAEARSLRERAKLLTGGKG